MSLFRNNKKKIVGGEMTDVRNSLYNQGFDQEDLKFVEVVFRADLFESGNEQLGIDETEITSAISWLKSHPHHHRLTENQLNILDKTLRNFL